MFKRIGAMVVLVSGLAPCLSAATISIVPGLKTVIAGSAFTLDVNITDASDVYAYQFDVSFTPGILAATAVAEGTFLATNFFPGFIDNASGEISFVADSLAGPVPGMSGSGTLARIEFAAIGAGMSSVMVRNAVLLNSNLSDIPSQLSGSQVTISAIPEPGSATLILVGAALAWVFTRGTRRVRSGLSQGPAIRGEVYRSVNAGRVFHRAPLKQNPHGWGGTTYPFRETRHTDVVRLPFGSV